VPKRLDAPTTLNALRATLEMLTALDEYSEATLETSLRGLAERLGLKAGDLFGAIRVATTGKTVAPPLFGSLHVLGREKTLHRLQEAVACLEAASV
jgi:glutamyl-tRNA synthetase